MQLSSQQITTILNGAPEGVDKSQVLDGLVARGYVLEGVDMDAARARILPDTTIESPETFSKKAARGLDTVFGGGTIGDAIGTQLAKSGLTGLSPEERALVQDGPSAKAVVGDTLRAAANFVPVGRAVTAGKAVLGGSKAAGVASNVAAGAGAGAAIDLSEDVKNERNLSLGAGTLFGAGIPATSPIFGALTRAAGRGAGIATSEIGGALTGTSAETLEQAFVAAKKGGNELDQFTDALRGRTTPEALVNQLRSNVDLISTQRQNLFRETLAELADETVNTAPAKSAFLESLGNARITVADSGALDFTNSKLKLVPAAQTKIQQAWQEVSALPNSVSLSDIDTTRQAIKALSLAGEDASANLGNKLIDDAVRAVRSAGEDVPGYGQMLDQFGETSSFLDEIGRGLSTGDTRTIDQTYRRMATALKTNNEQRMALVRELDELTDGAILSSVAGQQLSEALPRGLFRQISAGIAGGAILTGGISQSLIPALVLASPRVTGEFIRSLGIGASKAQIVIDAIKDARGLLIKTGAIGGAASDPSDQ